MKYVVVRLDGDGKQTAMTIPGPLTPTKNTMRRMRAIGIRPLAIAKNNAKGELLKDSIDMREYILKNAKRG
tara:strand:- start:272 stop:484 length:213 start_codon:yes stop_codon:yes gene_type:complete